MIIYIRHSEKEFQNADLSQKYGWDPNLTENGIKNATELGATLIYQFGIPDKIYCSPYRRTRQTLDALLPEEYPMTNLITVDPRIGEFLGEWPISDISIAPDTLQYLPIYDNKKAHTKRILDLHSEALKIKDSKVIWVIAHGKVLKTITKLYEKKSTHVPLLGYQIVWEGKLYKFY